MITCPNCTERIPFRTLAFGGMPIWTTCRHCKAGLAGNRFIQALRIADGLLVAGIVLFLVLLLLYDSQLGDIIPTLFVLFSLLGLIPIVSWLTTILLAIKYGRYVADEEHIGTPEGLRRYFLATGVVSILILAWLTIFADVDPVGILVLVSWALVPFLVLYPRYDLRLGRRTRKAAVLMLLLWAGAFNLTAIAFAPHAVAGFPKEGPVEERLVLSFGPQQEQDAWNQLEEMLGGTEPADQEVLDFLARNAVSMPENAVTFRRRGPLFTRIAGSHTGELEEIERLIAEGNETAASERYLQLWKGADNLISGKGSLIQHLVGVGQAAELIVFYLDGKIGPRFPNYEQLLAISSGMQSKIDDSFEIALSYEYFSSKATVTELRSDGCGAAPGILCVFSWPLFDLNRQLTETHEHFYRLAVLSREPTYRREGQIDSYNEYVDSITRTSLLEDPIGSLLSAVLIPLFGRFGVTQASFKDRLAILHYVVVYVQTGDLNNVPIDQLTGEPYLVTDRGDLLEIKYSRTKEDGEPAVLIEFSKEGR